MVERRSSRFGELLRRYRQAAGLTQEHLGERAGLSARGISDLERGMRRAPHPVTIEKLGAALGLSASDRSTLAAAAGRRFGPGDSLGARGRSGASLPAPPTPLVGREREVDEVGKLLETTRLLTLTGAGGCGKSCLALKVARLAAEADPDAVRLVDLSAVADPSLVSVAVAVGLGLREQPTQLPTTTLATALRDWKLLLVLDNCEHQVAACADLVDALLRRCPYLRILATSRIPLGVIGETTWRVPSLSLPATDGNAPIFVRAAASEAVQLFCARAAAALPGFSLSEANAEAVSAICKRLDGIPLAIELAAPWVRVIAVDELAARLVTDLDLLIAAPRSAPRRQQTLRATLEWSYALLGPAEQLLLQRLAVFAGSFTLAAAEAVGRTPESASAGILPALAHLVDASLVVSDPTVGRYRLLDTIRLDGLERLHARGQVEETRRRHASYYRDVALAALPVLWDSHLDRDRWFAELDRDLDNLRAAWHRAEEAGDVATSLWIGGALLPYFNVRGLISEARERLLNALDRSGLEHGRARAWALLAMATLARSAENLDEAVNFGTASVDLFRQLDDAHGLAHALIVLGTAYAWWEDVVNARPRLEEALELCRTSRHGPGVGIPLFQLGVLALVEGNYPRAEALLNAGRDALRERGDSFRAAHVLFTLGFTALAQQQPAIARARLSESLTIALGRHDLWALAFVIEGFACLVAPRQAERALRFAGAAEAFRERYDLHVSVRALIRVCERLLAPAWDALGSTAAAAAWASGRMLSVESILDELLAEHPTAQAAELSL